MLARRGFRTRGFALPTLLVLFVAACTESATAPVGGPAFAHGGSSHPVRLDFAKCWASPGVWQGTVTGDVTGNLQTVLTDLRVSGPIWHVRFDWIIDAGASSFIADLRGTLNTNTGRVVMNGRVTTGYLAGAEVHEEGQLVDAANLCFDGKIRVMPATARS